MREALARILFALGLCLAASGCETNVLYDGPELPDRIVVRGAFETGAPWRVQLQEAYSLRDRRPENGVPRPIARARVVVADENGAEVVLSHTRDGIYTSSGRPTPGVAYTLRATHPEWGTAEATGHAPPAPHLRIARFERLGEDSIGDVPTTVYEADLEVRAAAAGYLMLEGLQYIPRYGETTASLWAGVPLDGDTRVLRGSFADMGAIWIGHGHRYGRRYFMTPFASGETRTITVTIQAWRFRGARNELRVRASTLSEQLQQHLATLDFQNLASEDPFAEPIRLYSNVRGGHGIFAGLGVHEIVVPVPR